MKVPILLVDDDPDDLVALRATLEPLGLEIVAAESGEDALRLLLARDFAIVVMDLMMPGLNGFETAALIRERDRTRGMPLVILTGFDEDVDALLVVVLDLYGRQRCFGLPQSGLSAPQHGRCYRECRY